MKVTALATVELVETQMKEVCYKLNLSAVALPNLIS